MSNSWQPYRLWPARLLCTWDQATLLEWVVMPPSKGSPSPGIEPSSPPPPALQVHSLPLSQVYCSEYSILYICPSIIPEALHPPLRYSCLAPSSSLAFSQMSHSAWVLSALLIYVVTLSLPVLLYSLALTRASLVTQRVKNLPAMWETWVWSLGDKDPLKKGMASHCTILAWRIPWPV